ncbi:MAG: cytochrome c-type biogenesis protein CcmH [Myxococcota bacterium]|nr:cytochrome c-type biogenesis protein CcmH [Myxococcota bacterium]
MKRLPSALLMMGPIMIAMTVVWSAHAQTAPAQAKGQATATPGAPTPSTAQGAERLDPVLRRVRQLSDELRSPFCPGKTLMTCTSSQAFDLRRDIEVMVRAGKTDAQIIVELKEKYGDDVSNPQQPWYTFFVPFLPFIVLAGLIFWVIQRWRKGDDAADTGSADLGQVMVSENTGASDAERLKRLRARVWQNEDES